MPTLPSCLGAGRPARGPLSSLPEKCPLSPSAPVSCPSRPSPRLHCWCSQPSGGLRTSPFLHLQKMHFATYFSSLLLLGDSWEDRRGMLAFPALWDLGLWIRAGCGHPPGPGRWGQTLLFLLPLRSCGRTLRSRQCPGASHLCFVRRFWSCQLHLRCAKPGHTSAAGRRRKAASWAHKPRWCFHVSVEPGPRGRHRRCTPVSPPGGTLGCGHLLPSQSPTQRRPLQEAWLTLTREAGQAAPCWRAEHTVLSRPTTSHQPSLFTSLSQNVTSPLVSLISLEKGFTT